VPEAVHASERGIVRDEEAGSVREYGEEEAIGNTVAEERPDACPGGGKALDEGGDSLGHGQPVSEVVGGGEGGGEPVPKPPDHLGGVEEVAR